MASIFKGTPLLTSLLAIFTIAGTMVVAIRSDRIEQPDSIFNQTYAEIIAPGGILIHIIVLYIIGSTRYIELVIGTPRTLALTLCSLLLDFVVRTILFVKMDLKIQCSGPFALLSALIFSYWILFPTYRSFFLPISDKFVMLLMTILAGSFSDVLVVIPILCGLISVIILSPLIIPDEKNS